MVYGSAAGAIRSRHGSIFKSFLVVGWFEPAGSGDSGPLEMISVHLDLGCGVSPGIPHKRMKVHAVGHAAPEGIEPQRLLRRSNPRRELITYPSFNFGSVCGFDPSEHIPLPGSWVA